MKKHFVVLFFCLIANIIALTIFLAKAQVSMAVREQMAFKKGYNAAIDTVNNIFKDALPEDKYTVINIDTFYYHILKK